MARRTALGSLSALFKAFSLSYSPYRFHQSTTRLFGPLQSLDQLDSFTYIFVVTVVNTLLLYPMIPTISVLLAMA